MSYRSDMQKIKKAELFNMKSEEIMGVKGFMLWTAGIQALYGSTALINNVKKCQNWN